MNSEPRFSPRALCRLRIAATLMGVSFGDKPTEASCQNLLRRIEVLDSLRRERLRAQVDWVESYERAEAPVVHRNCGQGGG